MKKDISITILGFGTVGQGVVEVLSRCADRLHLNWNIHITHILVRDKNKARDAKIPEGCQLIDDPKDLPSDSDCVIEVLGGITTAYDLVAQALKNGSHVVTANKALMDTYYNELVSLAQKNQVQIKFEAAVAGGIPIIETINRSLLQNKVISIQGILNGTCNFILSHIEDGMSFQEALSLAQELGFAEADPSSDIDGWDTAHKLCLLSRISFEGNVSAKEISVSGIRGLEQFDIEYLHILGFKVKHLGIAWRQNNTIFLQVGMFFCDNEHILAQIKNESNAISILTDCAGKIVLTGQGAGRFPTASSVVADCLDIFTGIHENHIPNIPMLKNAPLIQKEKDAIKGSFYLRLTVPHQCGIMAQVTKVLADHNINIYRFFQDSANQENNFMHLIILTDLCLEKDILAALEALKEISAEGTQPIIIRELIDPS